jgi:hypothetical protein
MYGDNTLSIIQTNFIVKDVQDEKRPKWQKRPQTSWLTSPLLYSTSSSKTADAASVKKALATSQPIFKPTGPISSSQGRFLWRGKDTGSSSTALRDFQRQQRHQDNRPAFLFAEYSYSGPFSVQRCKVEAGRPLDVPVWPHEAPGGGLLNHGQKRVRCRLSAVDGPLQMICPNLHWGGIKKSWNSGVSTMIRIEVISPWALYSEHTPIIIFYLNFYLILSCYL